MTKKIAFVVQRFGREVLGGAENHALQLAEKLQNLENLEIEVFTTTAKEYDSWKSYYPEGLDYLDSISIHRFNPRFKRSSVLFKLLNRPLVFLSSKILPKFSLKLSQLVERFWYILQGPYCPTLISDLKSRESDFDHIVFFTYLYYLAYEGLKVFPNKAILVPTAHDEPPFWLPSVGKTLLSAKTLVPNTKPELYLLQRRLKKRLENVAIIGLGFEKAQCSLQPAQDDDEYILYLGRINRSKNVHVLIDYFRAFKRSYPEFNRLKLVLAGGVSEGFALKSSEDVIYKGFVNDAEKVSLIANSMAVVNPSHFESLSMIVLEALSLARPVLVDRTCDVLRYYSEELKTVEAYSSCEEFGVNLYQLLKTGYSQSDLDHSQRWVTQNYSWDSVLSKYRTLFEF